MRIVYVADDGKEFDDEFECEDYEWKQCHPHLRDVHMYDENGDELKNIFTQETYEQADKIVVSTDEAVKDLQELGKYTGFCEYVRISKSGTWIFDYKDLKFKKVEG